jgi:type I restriction-modification system DNA methylase subunit
MTQNEAKRKIQELVSKYEQVKLSGRIDKYSEQDTKDSFVRPMFEALGWDFDDREEVSKEEFVNSAGRVDYGIYLNNQPKLFIEAKKLNADIHKPEFAEQAIRYCFNRVVTWAVLTDFESLKVFNAQNVSENLSNKLYFEIPYSQYVERFDQIWQLSKESFETGLIDKEAMKVGKLQQKITVTEQLAKDLNEIRDLLTHNLHSWNPGVSASDLDEGVQKLLDRLIFLRVAEDRGIEEPILKQLIRDYKNTASGKQHLYESMIAKFRELDEVYNSGLFSEHPFEKWEEYSGATEKAIDILYGKSGYYEYDFKFIPSDVLGQVYENYLGHLLSKSRKGLTLDVSAKKRKEQGIYYTPSYIEDYIVEQALKPVLDNCHSVAELKTIKVLDPACGSGSFLIKAMEMIEKKYAEFGARKGEGIRLQVLLDNIYGVDLDEKAVEIARLNLVINSLETRMKLRGLEQNFKNGNSLISGTDEELKKYFGKNYRDKKPFNWEEEFPEVFNRPNPGFDVIIGNPPYVQLSMEDNGLGTKEYLITKYGSSMGRLNTYGFFMQLGINILRQEGVVSYIVPNTFISQDYYETLRISILKNCRILSLASINELAFNAAVVENTIFVFDKKSISTDESNKIYIRNVKQGNIITNISTVDQKEYYNSPKHSFNIKTNNQNNKLKIKIENDTVPLSALVTVNQAIALKGNREKWVSKINDEGAKPLLVGGKNIGRYSTKWDGSYLNYDKSSIHSGGTEEKFLTNEKILFRRVADKLIGTIDRKQFYALHTIVVINLKSDFKSDLHFLLGLFNSKLLNWYYRTVFASSKTVFAEVGARQISQLPIKLPSKEDQSRISRLVSTMLELNIHLLHESENSNKWNQLKSEIEKTDKQIDQLVYKLYGLTEQEVGIVESKSSKT